MYVEGVPVVVQSIAGDWAPRPGRDRARRAPPTTGRFVRAHSFGNDNTTAGQISRRRCKET